MPFLDSRVLSAQDLHGDMPPEPNNQRGTYDQTDDTSRSTAPEQSPEESMYDLSDGLRQQADYELPGESIWRVVFTKTCREQIQVLGLEAAAEIDKSFDLFRQGYPARAEFFGYSVRGRPAFVKALVRGDITLLWSVRVLPVPYVTSLEKAQHHYTQAIWVWAAPLKNDVEVMVDSINNVSSAFTEAYLDHCTSLRWDDEKLLPVIYSWNEPLMERSERISDAIPLDAEDEKGFNELDLAKAYELTPRVQRALVQGFLARVELPFVLSAEETALVHSQESAFVIGRSGTGKTTVMVLKMFAKAQASESKRCPQMLLTASPNLCLAIKGHYRKLGDSWTNRSGTASKLTMVDARVQEEFPLDMSEIPAYQDLTDGDFPVFWTFGYLLRVLDKSVPGRKFWGFKRIADGFGHPHEVDGDRFRTHYLHKLSAEAQTKFVGGSVIFGEIQTVIKGSLMSLELGRDLTREEYIDHLGSRANTLSATEMALIYQSHERYCRLLQRENEWDLNDAIRCLYHRNKEHPDALGMSCLETLAIDEVQDLNVASLALLKYLLNGPGAAEIVHFAGDAAQVINCAANFRFADLKGLYYSTYLPHMAETDPRVARLLRNGGASGGLVPKLKPLTVNYRSVEPIIALGNAILKFIVQYFPSSIDHLPAERGLARGCLPIFLEKMDIESFLRKIVGTEDVVQEGNIEFGADQAVIVRNGASKAFVRKILGPCAIILDIKECKGLEFEDVILYDFFANSAFSRWRILDDDTDFNALSDQALLFELKQLYVAVTRARTHLWIYDSSEKGDLMREYLSKRKLVAALHRITEGNRTTSLAKRSTTQRWHERGSDFLDRNDHEQALYCFIKSGDTEKESETRAHLLVAEASRLEGTARSSDLSKASRAREQAGEFFKTVGHLRQAAVQFQLAGRQLSRATLLIKAADLWILCGKTAQIGKDVLYCLSAAGPLAFDRLLAALQADWIARDTNYWRVFERFATAYGETADELHVLTVADMHRTFNDKLAYLESLGKREIVNALLQKGDLWERLGSIYEERLEIVEAEKVWRKIGYQETVQRMDIAKQNLRDWVAEISRPPPSTMHDITLITSGKTCSNAFATQPRTKISDFLRRFQGFFLLTQARDSNIRIKEIRGLLTLIERWHSKLPSFRNYSKQLNGGSWPASGDPEALGAYRAQYDSEVFLVATCQRDFWHARVTTAGVQDDGTKVALLPTRLARGLGKFVDQAISETQRLSRDVILLLRKSCKGLPSTREAFDLKIRIECAIGLQLMQTISSQRIIGLDAYIVHMDELLFPLDSASPTFDRVQHWCSNTGNQKYLRQVISSRGYLNRDLNFATITTVLRWTRFGREPLNVSPLQEVLKLLLRGGKQPVIRSRGNLAPLANSTLELGEFFCRHLPSLTDLKERSEVGNKGLSPKNAVLPAAQSAKAQLFVLEELFFSVACLIDRFEATLMPIRLMCRELSQADQNRRIAALMERLPDSLDYVDRASYKADTRFLLLRNELRSYLLDILTDRDKLQDMTGLWKNADLLAFIKRLIVMTICLCCSRDGTDHTFSKDMQRLKRVPLLCENPNLTSLRPAFARFDLGQTELKDIVASLAQVANVLGDPLRVLVDPLARENMEPIALADLGSIFPVYVRVTEGRVEVSDTEDFVVTERSCYTRNVGGVEGYEAPLVLDGEDTEESAGIDGTLEREAPLLNVKQLNLVVVRQLLRWRIRHYVAREAFRQSARLDKRVEEVAGQVMGADKPIFRRLLQLDLPDELRAVVFGSVVQAFTKLARSSYEAGLDVFHSVKSKSNHPLRKQVIEGLGRGSPVSWNKEFDAAVNKLKQHVVDFCSLLRFADGVYPTADVLKASTRAFEMEITRFDEDHKRVIEAFQKKDKNAAVRKA